MELPSVDAGSNVYFKYTDHFAGAVEGWSDAEIITADQRKAIVDTGVLVATADASLHGAVAAREAAERESTKMRARFAIRDVILDKRVMLASDGVLNGPAQRDRQHPVYQFVFDKGTAGDLTEYRPRGEPELVELMITRLGTVDDFEGKARIKADLDDALAKSVATLQALEVAESSERKAGDVELQARLAVRGALDKAYGLLRAAFPGQRKLVESFFYRAERGAKKAKAPAEGSGAGG